MVNPRTRQTVKTIYREDRVVSNPQLHPLFIQINGWILKHNEPLLINDISSDSRFRKVHMDSFSIKSIIGVPLKIESITIDGDTGGLFSQQKNRIDEWNDLMG